VWGVGLVVVGVFVVGVLGGGVGVFLFLVFFFCCFCFFCFFFFFGLKLLNARPPPQRPTRTALALAHSTGDAGYLGVAGLCLFCIWGDAGYHA